MIWFFFYVFLITCVASKQFTLYTKHCNLVRTCLRITDWFLWSISTKIREVKQMTCNKFHQTHSRSLYNFYQRDGDNIHMVPTVGTQQDSGMKYPNHYTKNILTGDWLTQYGGWCASDTMCPEV